MAEFKVYGMILSAPSRFVMTFLKANGIDFDVQPVDLSTGEQKGEAFLAVNKFGKVPALAHGDYSIGESCAIVQYVAEVKELTSHWWPQDVREKAKMFAILHWQHGNFAEKIEGYLYITVIGPKIFKKDFTQAQIDSSKAACEAALENVNGKLQEAQYITGTSQPNAADLAIFTYAKQLHLLVQFDFSPYSNLNAWFNRMQEIQLIQQINQEATQALEIFA